MERHAVGGREEVDWPVHGGQREEAEGGGCLGVGRCGRGDGGGGGGL